MVKRCCFCVLIYALAALCHGVEPFEKTPELIIAPVYNSDDINHQTYYFKRLLQLALDYTREEYGGYTVQEPPRVLADRRLQLAVREGAVDVMWHTSIEESVQGLARVPVGLLGELSQYRMLLVRRQDVARFNEVETVAHLRKFSAGLGAQWPDVDVLKHNHLRTVTAVGYEQLFPMLAAGRFDYFLRGIYQISQEQQARPELDLAIVPDLVISYPSDVYFFVRDNNVQLRERLTLGLERAMRSGSVDELMGSIPRFRWARQQIEAAAWRTIYLPVP
ncbi:transporter substrate-binding domain-containing protein [Gilvimarinus chinensis]|uniref:transporter substrate-binding domain-containing protein n=1 Tax=Gilvimarinus chinensis TaxID=396005 RepID=UPI0003779FD9|nr:transporter substrate-binding domain-containing protein [Gilvimarinus chinensis]